MKKIAGVGINDMPKGWLSENKLNRTIYDRWNRMLHRCYNKNDKDYKTYGAKGVEVEAELFYLSNYVQVLMKDPLWKEFCKNPSLYAIDKDINSSSKNKKYSKDTIKIVTYQENGRELGERNYLPNPRRPIIAINPDNGEQTRYESKTDFCKKHEGFSRTAISGVCQGKYKQHKKWFFKYDD